MSGAQRAFLVGLSVTCQPHVDRDTPVDSSTAFEGASFFHLLKSLSLDFWEEARQSRLGGKTEGSEKVRPLAQPQAWPQGSPHASSVSGNMQ